MNLQDASNVADLSYEQFERLGKAGKPLKDKEWTVLSTFSKHDLTTGHLKLISLATGTKCLSANNLHRNGYKLHDSHAEVIARRGFLCYILSEMKKASSGMESDFHISNETGKFLLRNTISYHFFTTHPPCGDASIVGGKCKINQMKDSTSFARKKQNLEENLECEQIHITGARLINVDESTTDTMTQSIGHIRTKPGKGIRTLSVSCSDKLLKWNAVGVQGALLMALLSKPIYLESFILGGKAEIYEQSLVRAIFHRFSNIANTQSALFCFQKPAIFVLPTKKFDYEYKSSLVPSPNSISWSLGIDSSPEISVNGLRLGVTKKNMDKPCARLQIARIEIFKRFLNVLALNKKLLSLYLPNIDSNEVESTLKTITYKHAKSFSIDYNAHWQALIKNYINVWTFKPDDLTDFCINDLYK